VSILVGERLTIEQCPKTQEEIEDMAHVFDILSLTQCPKTQEEIEDMAHVLDILSLMSTIDVMICC
jgi:hypothetical protein